MQDLALEEFSSWQTPWKCFFLNLGGFIVTDAMFKGLVIAVVPDSSHLTRLSSLGGE